MSVMNNYDGIAESYDLLMGDRSAHIATVRHLLREHMPAARSILDIGCGTGLVTARLAEDYATVGMDISPEMISVARARHPDLRFLVGDMTEFALDHSFDAAVCLFNAINQVTDFEGWRSAFSCASQHLKSGGVYIFDINTVAKHEHFVGLGCAASAFREAGAYYLRQILRHGTGRYMCRVELFLRSGEGRCYTLTEKDMPMAAFPLDEISHALRGQFSSVRAFDTSGQPASEDAMAVYFVCHK